MKAAGTLKHFGYAFLIALIGYVALYSCDSHLRQRKGPWQVTFTKDVSGSPAIIVAEPMLNIANVRIVFDDENAEALKDEMVVVFDVPARKVPFGQLIGDDLMYLPGTVVLECFGHEVQLLPRVLTLNRKEIAWQSDMTIHLKPGEKVQARRKP